MHYGFAIIAGENYEKGILSDPQSLVKIYEDMKKYARSLKYVAQYQVVKKVCCVRNWINMLHQYIVVKNHQQNNNHQV